MQIYSTDDVPSGQGFAYWRDVLTQHFVHLRPEPIGRGPFASCIHARELGGHSFSRVRAHPQRIHRTPREIARSPHDLIFLNLHLEGAGSYMQNGEERAVRPGDLFLIDAVRPFELGCGSPTMQLSLKVPRAVLADRMRSVDDAPGALIPAASHVGKLLGSYVAALWKTDESAAGPVAVEHLFSLAAFEIDRRSGKARIPTAAIRGGVFARARRHIERHLDDPDLAPAAVASAIGVSLRTLQSIFEEHHDAIARCIQRERIAAAARRLSDPELRRRTVGEIAFMTGFSELSHFSHAFVRAYGEPPGAWRRRMLDG